METHFEAPSKEKAFAAIKAAETPWPPSTLAPSKIASPSGAFSVTGGSARSGYEIIQSLKREGWTEDCMTRVFKSGDGRLVKIVWSDGKTAEARIEPNSVSAKDSR